MPIDRTRARLEPIPIETLLQNIVASIALQENALASVIDMEAEKMRAILGCSFSDAETLLRMNDSVQVALDTVGKLESSLTDKFKSAMRCLEPTCGGGGGDSGEENIPLVSIQVARPEYNLPNPNDMALKPPASPLKSPYLRARVWGKPQPGDRVYLRRMKKVRADENAISDKFYIKRMAHPVNLPSDHGGNLPPHLPGVTNFWGGEGFMQYVTDTNITDEKPCLHDPENAVPTEWIAPQDGQLVDLFSLDLLRCSYTHYPRDDTGIDPDKPIFSPFLNADGKSRSIVLDFVIARPSADGKTVTFGPPSNTLHIAPFFKKGSNGDYENPLVFLHWGVRFS
ncbi:MAG: hypothetical protein LBS11_03125 [Oscillospiraceae bacterium]|jgi:hypothetical protein|nr:hypothetical protein [Oscillospiraceae bacterium]